MNDQPTTPDPTNDEHRSTGAGVSVAEAPIPDQEPFAHLCEQARDLRGSAEDEQWAARATIALVLNENASTEATEQALTQALDTAQESAAEGQGEPLDSLFGPADAWAAEQVRQWRDTGADAFDTEKTFTLRRSIITIPGIAASFSVLLALSQLLQGKLRFDWTPGMILAPLILAALVVLANGVYETLKPRLSFGWTAVLTGLTVIVSAMLTALLFSVLTRPGHPGSLAWFLPLAGGYAVLCWLLAVTLPAPRTPGRRSQTPSAAIDDPSWEHRFLRAARSREDLSTTATEDALLEARAHGEQSGSTLLEQFGEPEAYARSLPGDRRVPIRRRMWLYASQGASIAVLLVLTITTGDDWGWNMRSGMLVAWWVLVLWSLIASLRDVRRTRADGSRR